VGGDAAQVMVGRDRELARVTGLLDDALAGRGRLVLCTGEAGIGKTRLAEELAAAASAREVPVAWARAADRGGSAPGVPITAAVSGASRGWYRLRVQIDGRQLTFLVSADGDIQAG